MPKSQLSRRAQIGLVLATIFLFATILTVVGFIAADETRRKMAAFATDSAAVIGTVTAKRVDSVRPTKGGIWVYWLDVTFDTQDGSTRSYSTQVPNTIYDQYWIGRAVRVTYVKSRPEWFYVPGAEPTARDAGIMIGMSKYGGIAAVLSALGLIGFLLAGRGGGTPSRQSPSPTVPPGRMPRQPRAEFGTRRLGQ
jgi:hypothetical protein